MKAVIMAGGKGTRLHAAASGIPKPMVPVCEKPVLEYQIVSLKKSGITDITIIIGYLGELIKDYFADGSRWGVSISYIVEDKPLGTAGALFYLKGSIKGDFLLIFGDLMLDVDWNRFMCYHREKGGWITLFGHPNSHPYDSDVIVVNDEGKVVRIEPKNVERGFFYKNFVNAGLYCVSDKLFGIITAPVKLDLEKSIISVLIPMDCVYAYRSTEYVKDMGTPDRLADVAEDVRRGIVESHSLRNKQKCIFLDRDGTLNGLQGFQNSADQFELLPGVAEAIREVNASEYLVIVTANQTVDAKGEYSFGEQDKIHRKMETLLGKQGAYLDDIFFSPHYPRKGYGGEIPGLKVECSCRKPKTEMLERAAEKYNIDLSRSWYVGGKATDIQTGVNSGMGTVLIRTEEAGSDVRYRAVPYCECEDLSASVKMIMKMAERQKDGLQRKTEGLSGRGDKGYKIP